MQLADWGFLRFKAVPTVQKILIFISKSNWKLLGPQNTKVWIYKTSYSQAPFLRELICPNLVCMYVRHAQKIAKLFFSVRSTQLPFKLNILFNKKYINLLGPTVFSSQDFHIGFTFAFTTTYISKFQNIYICFYEH